MVDKARDIKFVKQARRVKDYLVPLTGRITPKQAALSPIQFRAVAFVLKLEKDGVVCRFRSFVDAGRGVRVCLEADKKRMTVYTIEGWDNRRRQFYNPLP